jgi:hypothetical protein
MNFLLGIALTIGMSLLAAIALMAWAHRNPNATIPEPQATGATPELIGECRCDDCVKAVQPVQMVQVGLVTHLVQRDTIGHEYSSDCVCRPQPGLGSWGPMAIHVPLHPGAAA